MKRLTMLLAVSLAALASFVLGVEMVRSVVSKQCGWEAAGIGAMSLVAGLAIVPVGLSLLCLMAARRWLS